MYVPVIVLLYTVKHLSALSCQRFTKPADSLCGCFRSRAYPMDSGFHLEINFDRKFWVAAKDLHVRGIHFILEVTNEEQPEYYKEWTLTCEEDSHNCSANYNINLQSNTQYDLSIYLSCQPEMLCLECNYLTNQIVKAPETTEQPNLRTTTARPKSNRDMTMPIVLVLVFALIIVTAITMAFFVVRRSAAHLNNHAVHLNGVISKPLLNNIAKQGTSHRLLMVTLFGASDTSTKSLVDVLSAFENISVVLFADEMNVNQWIDTETKICDSALIVLPSFVEMFQSENNNYMVKAADYWLQSISRRIEEGSCRGYLIQFDLQVDLSNFKQKYPSLPYNTIFTLSNIASMQSDNNTYKHLQLLLQAIMGEDKKAEIDSTLRSVCLKCV